MFAAWYGGFGPAIAASVLGLAFSAGLLPPRGNLRVDAFDNQVGLVLYLFGSLGIALLGGSMRLAQRNAEANAQALLVAHEALRKEEELLLNLIEVQESEKQFLCREFHDGLIQYAVGSLMSLEGYKNDPPGTDVSAVIDTVIGNLRKGIDDGRRVIRGIRPAVLDDLNLEAAMHDLVHQFSTADMMVKVDCDPSIGRLTASVQTAIYRVVQEALNNARKHSGTDVVRIALRKANGELQIDVMDFGCGFDSKTASTGGFGLLGMTERVRLLGGECEVQSEIDAGTQIRVRLPIPLDGV